MAVRGTSLVIEMVLVIVEVSRSVVKLVNVRDPVNVRVAKVRIKVVVVVVVLVVLVLVKTVRVETGTVVRTPLVSIMVAVLTAVNVMVGVLVKKVAENLLLVERLVDVVI